MAREEEVGVVVDKEEEEEKRQGQNHHDDDDDNNNNNNTNTTTSIITKSSSNSSSLRSKAVHFVSDLTTVFLNPISDKPSPRDPPSERMTDPEEIQGDSATEEKSGVLADGPDTSSFGAFLYSLLSTSQSGSDLKSGRSNESQVASELPIEVPVKESSGRKSLLSRGRHSLGRAVSKAARLGGFRLISGKGNSDLKGDDINISKVGRNEGIPMKTLNEALSLDNLNLPEISEPSLLLSEITRGALYVALPVLAQGRKWVLLYSTWRNGISLSTLYRRSLLCPGLSLLVVGDRKGAVFGGLVESPLRPTNMKRYQGTNKSFVFTTVHGRPVIYRPTGENRYYTLCQTDFLAMGGGNHFALYLDNDLLNGSSSASDTYGNTCLASSEAFEVKEIELWGFVYASKYEEMISLLRTEAPGICRWLRAKSWGLVILHGRQEESIMLVMFALGYSPREPKGQSL